ncbi:MAG: hypothetical protein NZM27_07220 [Acetobacteraceae bacterium]|nr:hypothetical protein [Acetobacteraceae bacterium]MDW8399540.1 hypothetical protein [Acetobacteraceae bacterium]
MLALTEPLGRAAALLRLREVGILPPEDDSPAYEARANRGKPPSHNTHLALLAAGRRRPGNRFSWPVEYGVWMPPTARAGPATRRRCCPPSRG